MVTVRFYGDLKQFGSSFKMDVSSVPEALRALLTQISGLREHIEKGHYKVTADGKQLTTDSLETGLEKTLHLTPVTKGAGKNGGLLQTIAGVVLVVVGAVMNVYAPGSGTVFMQMGIGLALGGIAQMLTKIPKMETSKDSDSLKSSSFSNLSNMAAQGAPVPIIYGQMMVGSKVLSQGVRSIFTGSEVSDDKPVSKNSYVVAMEQRNAIKPKPGSPDGRLDYGNPKIINKNYTTKFVPKETQ